MSEVLKIQKTKAFKADAVKEVLALFEDGVDIVIIEQPKGIEIEDGERCNVFIRKGLWESFGNKLWVATNWMKIQIVVRGLPNCLYSRRNYWQTVQTIRTYFPEIEFQEGLVQTTD